MTSPTESGDTIQGYANWTYCEHVEGARKGDPRHGASSGVIQWIDNTGALAGLIKGYTKALDLGLIVNSYHAMAAGLGVDTYFEYVRSKANVADFPSRFERGKLREALVDAGLGHLYVEWVECVLPTFAEWKTTPPRAWLQRGAEEGRRTARGQEAPPAVPSKRARGKRVMAKEAYKPGNHRGRYSPRGRSAEASVTER